MSGLTKEFGKHYLVEYVGCNPKKLKFVEDVRPLFLRAAEKSRATIIQSFFHQFEPAGVTGIIMIAESHFSVHTWPENTYASFDILTCGEMEPEAAIEELRTGFEAQRVDVRVFPRGY